MNDTDTASAPRCCCGHPESAHKWTNGMITRLVWCGHGDVLPPDNEGYVRRGWCPCAQYHPALADLIAAMPQTQHVHDYEYCTQCVEHGMALKHIEQEKPQDQPRRFTADEHREIRDAIMAIGAICYVRRHLKCACAKSEQFLRAMLVESAPEVKE